jgi:hypothetical protein
LHTLQRKQASAYLVWPFVLQRSRSWLGHRPLACPHVPTPLQSLTLSLEWLCFAECFQEREKEDRTHTHPLVYVSTMARQWSRTPRSARTRIFLAIRTATIAVLVRAPPTHSTHTSPLDPLAFTTSTPLINRCPAPSPTRSGVTSNCLRGGSRHAHV